MTTFKSSIDPCTVQSPANSQHWLLF